MMADMFPYGGTCDWCAEAVFPEDFNVEAFELSGELLCDACSNALLHEELTELGE